MGGLQTLYDISNSRAGQPTFGPRTHIVRMKWVLWDREGGMWQGIFSKKVGIRVVG